MNAEYSHLKGKRIGAIDFGMKRVGFAVCDELHITSNPKKVLDPTKESFWKELTGIIHSERVAAIIVGVPWRLDNKETDVIEKINEFITELKNITGLEIITRDESFTTKRAVETLINIGKKKKKRSEKGMHDKIAAAIILNDFLREIE
jgi:putative holliday junction resolvase